jgi:hypothetical protein
MQARCVTGTVFASGRAVEGAVLLCRAEKEGFVARTAVSDSQGRFEIPLDGASVYSLTLDATIDGWHYRETRRFEAREQQSRTINFELRPIRVTGKISFPANMNPVARLRVCLQDTANPARDELYRCLPDESNINNSGEFVLMAPDGGSFRLVICDPLGEWATTATETFQVVAGGSSIHPPIDIARAGTLTVRAYDRRNDATAGRVWVMAAPPDGPLVHLVQGWIQMGDDGISFRGLKPGRYIVAMPGFEDRIATVEADRESPVEFRNPHAELPPGGAGAYRSREARLERDWNWGGQSPDFYYVQPASRPVAPRKDVPR